MENTCSPLTDRTISSRSGNFEQDCRAVMTLVNQKYEGMIRKYPDQWFSLLYPRWSNQPEDR